MKSSEQTLTESLGPIAAAIANSAVPDADTRWEAVVIDHDSVATYAEVRERPVAQLRSALPWATADYRSAPTLAEGETIRVSRVTR